MRLYIGSVQSSKVRACSSTTAATPTLSKDMRPWPGLSSKYMHDVPSRHVLDAPVGSHATSVS